MRRKRGSWRNSRNAHTDIKTKNKAFVTDTIKCPTCAFRTESQNVLQWHLEFAHNQDAGVYACRVLQPLHQDGLGSISTNMENEHKRKGRIYMRQAQFSCPLCPFENNKRATMLKHRLRCQKVFNAKRNLEPSPTDCDIPLKKTKKQLAAAAAANSAQRMVTRTAPAQGTIIHSPRPSAPPAPPYRRRPSSTRQVDRLGVLGPTWHKPSPR